jgi:hypothetical protein
MASAVTNRERPTALVFWQGHMHWDELKGGAATGRGDRAYAGGGREPLSELLLWLWPSTSSSVTYAGSIRARVRKEQRGRKNRKNENLSKDVGRRAPPPPPLIPRATRNLGELHIIFALVP